MQEHSNLQLEQNYYQRSQIKPGWQDVVQVLFSGILSSAEDEDARQFLTMMGMNLARQEPLPACATLGELEDNLNSLLRRFDWGVIKIEATEQRLDFVHIACPRSPAGSDDNLWQIALIAFLEGAYTEWLRAQGGLSQVPLRWLENTGDGAIVFRYQNGQ
jgi:hypothetical protein